MLQRTSFIDSIHKTDRGLRVTLKNGDILHGILPSIQVGQQVQYGTRKFGIRTNGHVIIGPYENDMDREDGPAVELADGSYYWMRGCIPHREDGPAVVRTHGINECRVDGWLQSLNGAPSEINNKYMRWSNDSDMPDDKYTRDASLPSTIYYDGRLQY